jgi:soluble lytic murein transglycosylase-like protein
MSPSLHRPVLIGLFLIAVWGIPPTAQGQRPSTAKEYVRHIARRTHPKPPAQATQRRLQEYDTYIRYFSGLAYTRAGVSVNAHFVRALIAAESAARPHARSSDGALGLLQIRPSTGRRAARELYATGYDFRYVDRERLRALKPQDLKDPATNILIGCYLLDRYNAEFGGHLARTVGAWNAGAKRVRQYEGTPPYAETLGLIARVNAFYLFFLRR